MDCSDSIFHTIDCSKAIREAASLPASKIKIEEFMSVRIVFISDKKSIIFAICLRIPLMSDEAFLNNALLFFFAVEPLNSFHTYHSGDSLVIIYSLHIDHMNSN